MGAISSIFGATKKAVQTVQQPTPQVNQEPASSGDKKKNLVRALLLGTATAEGDLGPAAIGRRKLLGN